MYNKSPMNFIVVKNICLSDMLYLTTSQVSSNCYSTLQISADVPPSGGHTHHRREVSHVSIHGVYHHPQTNQQAVYQ